MLFHLTATRKSEAIIEARKMITGDVTQERYNENTHYFMLENHVYFAVEENSKHGFLVVGEQSAKNYKIILSISRVYTAPK